jgi:hypothetical protein
MLMSLTLLAEDAKTVDFISVTDCVVARAAKRVMKPEFIPVVGTRTIDIYNKDTVLIIGGLELSRRFMGTEMREMAELNENRTIQVDIPEEFLL